MKIIILALHILFGFNTSAMTSSVPATGELWQSVALIKVPLAPSQNPEDGDLGYCNGTLISSTQLVSAAHCFLNSNISKENPLVVEIGQYRFIEKNGQRINTGYYITGKFNVTGTLKTASGRLDSGITNDPDNDFAVFTFSEPLSLPLNFYYLPVWKGELPALSQIQDLYVVSINYVATISSVNARQIGTLKDVSVSGRHLETRGGSTVEPGDSGAPLTMMYQNKVYLVGVTKGHAESWFSAWDVFTLFSSRL